MLATLTILILPLPCDCRCRRFFQGGGIFLVGGNDSVVIIVAVPKGDVEHRDLSRSLQQTAGSLAPPMGVHVWLVVLVHLTCTVVVENFVNFEDEKTW